MSTGELIPAESSRKSKSKKANFRQRRADGIILKDSVMTTIPRSPVAWDKVVGFGHNGQCWPEMMDEVVLLDGSTQFISKSRWPEFIAD
jgi:hypothetical protein